MLHLARLVVYDHDGRFLFLAAPDGEPDLVARLVVLGLHNTLGSFAQLGGFRDFHDIKAFIQIIDVIHRDRLTDCGVRVQRIVDPQVFGLRMGLDEQ